MLNQIIPMKKMNWGQKVCEYSETLKIKIYAVFDLSWIRLGVPAESACCIWIQAIWPFNIIIVLLLQN